jgi:hypothetical protein
VIFGGGFLLHLRSVPDFCTALRMIGLQCPFFRLWACTSPYCPSPALANFSMLCRVPQLAVTIDFRRSRPKNQIAKLQSLVNTNNVPLEAIEQSEKQPFAALIREAKAAARIAVSFSLNWRACLQRKRAFAMLTQMGICRG